MTQHYLIALGGNVRHQEHGTPRKVLIAAVKTLHTLGTVLAASDVIDSAPIGPSSRRYANAAALLETGFQPEELMDKLKGVERSFGKRAGQRWSARVLDLDIILWREGVFASPVVQIPHPAFRQRDFVLGPAASIAPDWVDPLTSLSLNQLKVRLTKPRPIRSGRLR